MKTLLLLLALALPALAVRIHDTDIRDSSGVKIITGRVSICPPNSFSSGSYWIAKDCVVASITAGVLDINLQAGSYRAHWVTPAIEDQNWLVAGAGPLRVVDVLNLRTGLFCGNWVGGAFVGFATCPSGGGTPSTWSAMTGTWSTYTSTWSTYH